MTYRSPCFFWRREIPQWCGIDAKPPAFIYLEVSDDNDQQEKKNDVSVYLVRRRFLKEAEKNSGDHEKANRENKIASHGGIHAKAIKKTQVNIS